MVIISVFAPFITRYSLWKQDYSSLLQKPGESHLFGTDHYGRDTFTRIIYGGRISLLSALGAASMAGVIGVFLGLLAGYFGGYVNRIIQALVDIFWSFPSLLMALVLVVIMGPGIVSVMVAIAFGYWPEYAQVIRSEVLSIRKKEYVIAARALGNTDLKIIFKHILPNVIAPVVVLITITMGYAIIVEASLSFLGLGIQPPMSSWGTLLSDSREFLAHAPWLSIFPGLAIIITVLGFNMFGDGLRDFLDPYQRGL
jgi:peptide/nickel transport system permease protein